MPAHQHFFPESIDAGPTPRDRLWNSLDAFSRVGMHGNVLRRQECKEEGWRNQDGSLVICGTGGICIRWNVLGIFSDTHHHKPFVQLANPNRRTESSFVLTRYVVARGVILLVLFGAPLHLNTAFHPIADEMLALIVGVLAVMMMLLGHIEWRCCEQDC